MVGSPAPAVTTNTILRGVLHLLSRSMIARLTGLLSSVALARLLVPDEFGQAAVAMSIANIAMFFLDSGLAAAALRSAEDPSVALLRAIAGLQLAVAAAAATAGTAIALTGSHASLTVAALCILPILALQTPLLIVAERALDFRQISNADLSGTLMSQATTLALATIGLGVWSLVIGVLIKPLVSGIWMAVAGDRRLLIPSRHISIAFPLLRDALRLQIMPASIVLRDQGSTLIAATAVGTTALGVWVLVGRLLSIPAAVYSVLGRVAYPTMSAKNRAGSIEPAQLQRAMRRIAILSAWLLGMTCAGCLYAVPIVFGDDWSPATTALIAVCPGMLIGTAVATPTTSLLMIERRVIAPTAAVALNAVATWTIISSGVIGDTATTIGIATSVGTILEVAILLKILDQRGLPWLTSVRAIASPLAVGALAVGAGAAVGHYLNEVAAASVAPLIALGILSLLSWLLYSDEIEVALKYRRERSRSKLE